MLKECGGVVGRAALSALHHHVKKPGCGGYPENIKLSQVKDIDLIIQFCDIYDALVTKRPYKGIVLPFQALHIVYNDFEQKIETRVAAACVKALQDGFIGAEVEMPDGSFGTLVDIIDCNPVGKPVIELRTSRRKIEGDEPVCIIGCCG
jgi:HD-GYP domain-containing protein (c-di-GMP phosphodiesterase class II)